MSTVAEQFASDDWSQAVEWLRDARNIVVSTGAGISADSGIATFRDESGFWTRFPPEEFASWTGLAQTALLEPKRLADFLLAILEPIAHAKPNAAHLAIARMEDGKDVTVVTQNIDGLHQAAGSHVIHEVHGSLFEVVSMTSSKRQRVISRNDLQQIIDEIHKAREQGWTGPRLLKAIQPIFGFDSQGMHRPNLVLFGDAMAEPAWSNALEAAERCQLLISVGTSQTVYPAALLPEKARDAGANTIVIDPVVGGGDIWLPLNASTALPQLVAEALNDSGT